MVGARGKLARVLLPFLLLAMAPGLGAQDGPPVPGPDAPDQPKQETPEERALRMKVLAGKIETHLANVLDEDVVVRGNALEAILEAKADLVDVAVDGLVDRIRESGLTATDRFIAVMAGEILAVLDPDGTVGHVKSRAFGQNSPARLRRNGLAILSEIRTEESAKILADHAAEGTTETRCQALIGLAKLRMPSTYGALAAALASGDKDVKDNAAIALGCLGDDRCIPALLGHLEDADGDHPAFAAWALKQFDDPRIFEAVANNLKSDSGEPGDAKARVLEACARPEHVEKLREILKGSRSTKFRSAAALALGRLCAGDDESQDLLLKGLTKGKDERVSWACFFGLSRLTMAGEEAGATTALAEGIIEELKRNLNARSDPQHRLLRCLAFLAGDLRLGDAAPHLLNGARLHQVELTWRVCAANFWKCAGREDRRKIRDDFDASDDDRVVGRLAAIFGRSHDEDEFRYLISQFRRFRPGSDAAFSIELALEQMTGHFFGADYAIWRHWNDKNPDFFQPREYRIDRRKWQAEFDRKEREFRQTEETERSVQLGLAWIARHQNLQGALDPNRFFDRCTHEPGCKKVGARHMLDNIGCTSLAALGFLGGGYSPEAGKFKDELRRYLTYIEVRQTADGNYTTTDRFQGYQRPIAIYALAEAYNITGNDRTIPYLRRGIDFLTEIQNEIGGWHYQVGSRETDTSVMSWVLLGLGVAHKSGFPVRESVFEGCRMIMDMYSERVTEHREEYMDLDPHYGYDVGKNFRGEYQTGYQSRVSENATVAFGLMSRMFMGWRRSHPFCIGSGYFILNRKMEEIPKGENFDKYVSKNRFPAYAWYYGTLAMHQMGGHFFREWNQVIKKLLPGIQLREGCDAGAWPVLNYDFVAGKAYTTCMGVLTLETYYRYKPFCEEGLPEEEED